MKPRWLSLARTPLVDPRWRPFALGTALIALLSIPVVMLLPGSIPLVWLAVISLPANSPLSPFVPTAYEPLIMEAAKYSGVLPVSVVALVMYLHAEIINWHVYSWVLSWQRLSSVRASRGVRWGVDHFGKNPFMTTIVFAFTPLPFWAARSLAILHRYSIRRFLAATALGRYPRFLVYAWLGELLRVPTVLLIALIVGSTMIVVGRHVIRRRTRRAQAPSPVAPDRVLSEPGRVS